MAVSCGKCGVPFHRECWQYNEGCGIYGCGCAESREYSRPLEGETLAITEDSRPPFSPWPYVERLARSLPRWGRVHGTAALLGCAGPIMAVLAFVFTSFCYKGPAEAIDFLRFFMESIIFDWHIWVLFSVGPLSGLACSFISPYERKWGALIGGLGFGFGLSLIFFTQSFIRRILGLTYGGLFTGVTFLFFALVASSSTAGWLIPRERTKTRAVTTVLVLSLYLMALSTYRYGAFPHKFELIAIAITSCFGFAVTSPQLVFSKSALFHRLKAEESDK